MADHNVESRKVHVHITPANTVKAGKMIEAAMEPSKTKLGFFVYKDGYSDASIASAIGQEGISADHIGRLRASMGMPINRPIAPSVEAVHQRVEVLIAAHNQLCDALSLNRVLDVRKLKIVVQP